MSLPDDCAQRARRPGGSRSDGKTDLAMAARLPAVRVCRRADELVEGDGHEDLVGCRTFRGQNQRGGGRAQTVGWFTEMLRMSPPVTVAGPPTLSPRCRGKEFRREVISAGFGIRCYQP